MLIRNRNHQVGIEGEIQIAFLNAKLRVSRDGVIDTTKAVPLNSTKTKPDANVIARELLKRKQWEILDKPKGGKPDAAPSPAPPAPARDMVSAPTSSGPEPEAPELAVAPPPASAPVVETEPTEEPED